MTTVAVSPTGVLGFPDGGGHWWAYLQYVLGLAELACDVWWLERLDGDGSRTTAEAALRRLERFGLRGKVLVYEADSTGTPVRWLRGDRDAFARLAAKADLLINFDYRSSEQVVGRFARSAFVDLDPGLLQQWVAFGQLAPAPHDHWFTIGETVGTARACFPDAGIDWHRIGRVVHLPSWPVCPPVPDAAYTTVTSWWGDEWITDGAGLLYENNKRVTFLEYADLPLRSGEKLELAAYFGDSRTGPPRPGSEVKPEEAAGDAGDVRRMRRGGWRLRRSAEVAADPWAYRRYIQGSRGEFSCAKPSCLVLQNAWVSDRTLCYLASGRPAVVQHTGPSDFLPDAEGLFRFSCRDEAVEALRTVERDYRRQRTAARELAESLFDSGPILSRLLDTALSNPAGGRGRGRSGAPSHEPRRGPDRAGPGSRLERRRPVEKEGEEMASIAVGLVPRERFSMAGQVLERLLACTPEDFELVVVDAGTPARFRADMDRVLEGRPDVVRPTTDEILLPNEARNVVIDNTDADWICFLENDVLVEPGWLRNLLTACEEEEAAVAVPLILERFGPFEAIHFDDRLHTITTVDTPDGTGLRIEPRPDSKESDRGAGRRRVDFVETHCMLFSRRALERTGLFDPSITAQEEMDVSLALHAHGLPALLEPAAVVTFHPPPPVHPEEREFYLRKWDPEAYARDYRRVAERWRLMDPPSAMGVVETRRSYVREPDPARQVAAQLAYRQRLADTATDLAAIAQPEGPLILVHGEELNLNVVAPGLEVLPFLERGGLPWGPPPDDDTAIAELERMRAEGATVIAFAWPSFWWLDHYRQFAEYLPVSYPTVLRNDRLVAFDLTDSISTARDETTPRTRQP